MKDKYTFDDFLGEQLEEPEFALEYEIAGKVLEIMALPYRRKFQTCESDGTILAEIVEFEGCFTFGETQKEAEDMLEDAMYSWLYIAVENGEKIPSPKNQQ